jgi:hypothetical protein
MPRQRTGGAPRPARGTPAATVRSAKYPRLVGGKELGDPQPNPYPVPRTPCRAPIALSTLWTIARDDNPTYADREMNGFADSLRVETPLSLRSSGFFMHRHVGIVPAPSTNMDSPL